MAPFTVRVESKAIGGRGEASPPPVLLQMLEQRLTVAELIRRTVEEQVRDLWFSQKLEAEAARRILDRQYLTDEEVTAQAQQGAVCFPSCRCRKPAPEIDLEVEVARAQKGFAVGRYHIVADGRRLERLDQMLTLTPEMRVVFLRAIPLVGG